MAKHGSKPAAAQGVRSGQRVGDVVVDDVSADQFDMDGRRLRSHRVRRHGRSNTLGTRVHKAVFGNERDFGLAGICAMLVIGFIFNAFGLSAWVFGFDKSTSWTFWLIGVGIWLLALAIFFYFMNDPYPKHLRRR